MTIHYTLIFFFLVLELLIFAILILPLPLTIRKYLINILTKSKFGNKLKHVIFFFKINYLIKLGIIICIIFDFGIFLWINSLNIF